MGHKHPNVIFNRAIPFSGASYPLADITPFASYAINTQANYILAMREVIFVAGWLRSFTPAEQEYAAHILRKYYVRTRQAIADDSESHFQ
jgi:hypothetical protein